MRNIFIIAEAGVNHNGSLGNALHLIDVAATTGVDAVKFQTFRAEMMVCLTAEQADYQKKNIGQITSQYEMLKKLELSPKDHEIMMEHSKKKGIEFLSTPFDYSSINLLNRLGLETFKIPSGEITNLPYLRYIGKLGKKVILSTGMATMEEVEDALEILVASGTPKCRITVLHANTQYPTPMRDVNLKAMLSIQKDSMFKWGIAIIHLESKFLLLQLLLVHLLLRSISRLIETFQDRITKLLFCLQS
jgi:N,N'-diacetyllegionaminate synthase